MSDLTRGERLQIMLTAEELEALDNWRFARRMPSRASADSAWRMVDVKYVSSRENIFS